MYTCPDEESRATPAGKLNFALVPVASENWALPSPVTTAVETVGEEYLNALVTESVAAVKEVEGAALPQARTTLEGLADDNTVAAHFTQALSVNAEDPVESAGTEDVDTYDPVAKTMAVVGNWLAFEK